MSKKISQSNTQFFKTRKKTLKSMLSEFLLRTENQGYLLLITSKDAEELKRIESFVRLIRHQIKDRKNNEMEQLIELAMPTIILQQPIELLDQAGRNASLRANFVKTCKTLNAKGVHDFCRSVASDKAALVGDWRKKGKIFGIKHNNRRLYPAFQFDRTTGKQKPVIAGIIKALGTNMGSWQTAMWFTTPNSNLKNRRPIDLLDEDPKRVVNAAKQLFKENLF